MGSYIKGKLVGLLEQYKEIKKDEARGFCRALLPFSGTMCLTSIIALGIFAKRKRNGLLLLPIIPPVAFTAALIDCAYGTFLNRASRPVDEKLEEMEKEQLPKIRYTTVQELPPYLCRLGVTFQRECFCEGGEDKRIPLLRGVFDAFPNTPVNIDIKVNNDTLIKKVSELIVKYDREHLTVWGNSSNQIVKKCYRENPQIPVLFSFPRVLQLLGLFYTGLLPFVPIKEQFLEIPMPSIITKLEDPNRLTRSQRFIAWLADTLLMRKALFDHLTARGIQVYIWVLNDEEDFRRAFDLGATGVMTDFPTKLKDFMERSGLSKVE